MHDFIARIVLRLAFISEKQIFRACFCVILCPLLEHNEPRGSQWRLILAVDYQFSTNLVPLVAAPAFVPLITPWLPLSPPAGYIRSALHITPRYISTILHRLTSLTPSPSPFFSPLDKKILFGHQLESAIEKDNCVAFHRKSL